jgi:GNAT superfamily N-acetyltransferase
LEINLSIRRALSDDCDDIAELVRQYWAFEHIEGFDRERIVHLLRNFVCRAEQGGCWIVGDAGALRGYLLATYLFSLEFGGTMAEIDELYVLEQYRADGLGTCLVQQAVAAMKGSGLVHVQLQLGTENLRGREFYHRQGFTERCGYQLFGKSL